MTEAQARMIRNNFAYHPPREGQPEKYVVIRDDAKVLAMKLCELCPDSPELSIALSRLEEAVMWANASIARNT